MISIEHYVACQEALAPLFPKLRLECNLADFRMEAWSLLKKAGIKRTNSLSHWENMEPLWDYLRALASLRRLEESEDPDIARLFPAWELIYTGGQQYPSTDWSKRWHAAGESVAWEGACRAKMIALKSSPIWKALGDGTGGFGDALGNPYPPFAIDSSYAWVNVDRLEARALGLIDDEGISIEIIDDAQQNDSES